MRKRFEQQLKLGSLPIQETIIPTAKRSGALPGLCAALKEIFANPNWNEKVFDILDKAIRSKKKENVFHIRRIYRMGDQR
ncbi:hypothetical protein [Saccharicrinis fermentans]|uniref:hypothetical protein n=2 Tax=Saccharicrinis fermentans TaxID=982 RepID=UPI000694535D|nr:hypothetical protein [Saccharicrinis fermentans]